MIPFHNILNYIGDIIPEAIGALIGVMGALYIFRLQLRKDKKQQRKKSKQEQLETLRFSGIILESIISTFEKEVKILDEYQLNIQLYPYLQIHQPSVLATNDIHRLLKIMEGSDYLNSYMRQIGSSKSDLSNYNKIAKSIDYLSVVREQIQNNVNLAIDRDFERRTLYNSNVTVNVNALKDYCYDNILTHIEFLEVIIPVNIVYGNDEEYNLNQHAKFIVEPIIRLIQSKYNMDLNLKSIEFELHQAIGIANHTVINNRNFGREMKGMINDIKLTISILKENSKKLKIFIKDKA